MSDIRYGDATSVRLQDLLLNSDDIVEFLDEFSVILADRLAEKGEQVWCAVTLEREKRPITVGSSGAPAEALDDIQNECDDGPCLAAMRTHTVMRVDDVRTDTRWPEFHAVADKNGVRSVLGVPFELGDEARAALNMYSDRPGEFTDDKVPRIQDEVLQASNALLLAVRLCRHSQVADDLRAAMAARTTIDLAVGIIMGQNRCSQERAVEILKGASSHRNVKLHELAAELVAKFADGEVVTHFDP